MYIYQAKCPDCDPGGYCPDDNLHYPAIMCEQCYQDSITAHEEKAIPSGLFDDDNDYPKG